MAPGVGCRAAGTREPLAVSCVLSHRRQRGRIHGHVGIEERQRVALRACASLTVRAANRKRIETRC